MEAWPTSLVAAGEALDAALAAGDPALVEAAQQQFCAVLAGVGPTLPDSFSVSSLSEWMEKRGFAVGRR